MKKNEKKVFADAALPMMVLAILPTAVFAEEEAVAKIGETTYESLLKAVEAVPTDGTETTIVMIADETIASNDGVTIAASQSVVLDLNGFTIKNLVNENRSSQVIANKGILTICDNTDAKTGILTNAVAEGTAAGEWWGTTQYNYATNVITNSGILTVASGEILETAVSSICYAIDNNSTSADAIINIQGGNIRTDSSTAVRMFCNSTTKENIINVSGGTVEGGYAGIWVQLPGNSAQKKKATLNISGGALKGDYAFYDYSYGDVFDEVNYILSGGTFDGDIFSYGANMGINGGEFDGYLYTSSGKMTISGGIFNDDVVVDTPLSAELSVTGGQLAADVYYSSGEVQETFISGGVFALDPEGYIDEYTVDYDFCIDEGYSVIVNTDPKQRKTILMQSVLLLPIF